MEGQADKQLEVADCSLVVAVAAAVVAALVDVELFADFCIAAAVVVDAPPLLVFDYSTFVLPAQNNNTIIKTNYIDTTNQNVHLFKNAIAARTYFLAPCFAEFLKDLL